MNTLTLTHTHILTHTHTLSLTLIHSHTLTISGSLEGDRLVLLASTPPPHASHQCHIYLFQIVLTTHHGQGTGEEADMWPAEPHMSWAGGERDKRVCCWDSLWSQKKASSPPPSTLGLSREKSPGFGMLKPATLLQVLAPPPPCSVGWQVRCDPSLGKSSSKTTESCSALSYTEKLPGLRALRLCGKNKNTEMN